MQCPVCMRKDVMVSEALGACSDCLRRGDKNAVKAASEFHQRSRISFTVPVEVPNEESGIECRRCANRCRIAEGSCGYCGIRTVRNGRLRGGKADAGILHYYPDPLPTNCVADWVCPGGTGAGYPKFAHTSGPELGFYNLAVFYLGCTFDCLFCQNWQWRNINSSGKTISSEELADTVDESISCICYFGGDPTPHIHHALAVAKMARRRRDNGILRICWETNGAMSPKLLRKMIRISLKTGGCIKFDLKAWNDNIHKALTGASNRQTLENVDVVMKQASERPEPPLFVASTLLVPGYVDAEEVGAIAHFLADRSPDIPYSLLAFAPHYKMSDLPATSQEQATRCLEAAREAGLTRVRVGNQHLLC